MINYTAIMKKRHAPSTLVNPRQWRWNTRAPTHKPSLSFPHVTRGRPGAYVAHKQNADAWVALHSSLHHQSPVLLGKFLLASLMQDGWKKSPRGQRLLLQPIIRSSCTGDRSEHKVISSMDYVSAIVSLVLWQKSIKSYQAWMTSLQLCPWFCDSIQMVHTPYL